MNKLTLAVRHALALASLLAFAAFAGPGAAGCASREAEPSAPAKDAQAGQYAYPPPATAGEPAATAPYPSVTSGKGDLSSEEAAFEDAFKQLGLALDGKTAAGTTLSTEDRCTVVCKALTSMRNSAQHICGLQADRCASVQERVKGAEERAKPSCPVCSTPT